MHSHHFSFKKHKYILIGKLFLHVHGTSEQLYFPFLVLAQQPTRIPRLPVRMEHTQLGTRLPVSPVCRDMSVQTPPLTARQYKDFYKKFTV